MTSNPGKGTVFLLPLAIVLGLGIGSFLPAVGSRLEPRLIRLSSPCFSALFRDPLRSAVRSRPAPPLPFTGLGGDKRINRGSKRLPDSGEKTSDAESEHDSQWKQKDGAFAGVAGHEAKAEGSGADSAGSMAHWHSVQQSRSSFMKPAFR
jgi:hypothetical protein